MKLTGLLSWSTNFLTILVLHIFKQARQFDSTVYTNNKEVFIQQIQVETKSHDSLKLATMVPLSHTHSRENSKLKCSSHKRKREGGWQVRLTIALQLKYDSLVISNQRPHHMLPGTKPENRDRGARTKNIKIFGYIVT